MKTKLLAAKIHNLRFWVTECDPMILKVRFQNYLEKVGFVILNCADHHFPVQGYTALWMLAESHLAIHTFPDEEFTYVELSSCNQEKSEQFKKMIEESDLSVNWNGDGVEICKPEDN